ncbi:hypothetical protein C8R46DRAFT_1194548 [Mycena filopes]|nr:hypothetical protein C8R46DRAFT_1194548 [Mycena filopes]
MTTTRLRVRFQGLPQTYTAIPWSIPGHDGSFQPLPADATALVIPKTRSLFVNRYPDRRSHELSLDEARTWGTADPDDTETIFVWAKSPTSHRFCLRLVLNPRKVVRQRNSPQYQAYKRLLEDAKFHSDCLPEIEGGFVPRHYGMWLMDSGEWAGPILFSLTQWGGISWHDLSYSQFNTEANRILVGLTFEALHDAGVDHGGLGNSHEFRHVVIDLYAPGLSKDDRLNGKAPCYIVGFSEADGDHFCNRKLPILPLGSFLYPDDVGCSEIGGALILLKLMQHSDKLFSASDVLDWHTKYSELHPDAPNLEVLLVQRAKFFPSMPQIYRNQMRITFDEDDEYAATITMLDSDEEIREEEQTSGESDTVVKLRSDCSTPELIEVAIGKLQRLPHAYTAVPWKIPGHDGLFQPLPADATALIIPKTRSLFINCYPSRRPRELTLDEARTWGTADPDNTETIFVRAKSTTSHRFCLRLVLDPRKVVRQRASPQYKAYERLIQDAKFHSNYLSEAEGSFVPRHYGMWLMDTGEWAGQILFSLSQWGGVSWTELSHTKFNTEANRILVGRMFEALHDYGVDHGRLTSSVKFRHVVVDIHAPGLSKDDRLNGKAPCYLVVIPASELLHWHTKYSERHPNTPNLEVLLAQRAKFFPAMPRVYPNQMRITFNEDDEYAAVIFTVDSDEEAEPTSGESDTVVGFQSDSLTPEPVEVVTGKFQRMQLQHLLLA